MPAPRPLSYDELLEIAEDLDGVVLTTVTGRRFRVGIYRDCPFFTPESTGLGRSDGRKAAERFLDRYNATGSEVTADYADVTRNASYFLGMLRAASARPRRAP